jgi:hypothetical protein
MAEIPREPKLLMTTQYQQPGLRDLNELNRAMRAIYFPAIENTIFDSIYLSIYKEVPKGPDDNC